MHIDRKGLAWAVRFAPKRRSNLTLAGRAISVVCLVLPMVTAGSTGLEKWPAAAPYLQMPPTEQGPLPRLLSQTGAFEDLLSLRPRQSLVPYDLTAPFWSDGANKLRWIALPASSHSTPEKICFAPTGEWQFPNGTVFVKHFELGIDDSRPELKRRLETRLLVRDSTGGVYGVTYKWRPDQKDAELVTESILEAVQIKSGNGYRSQNWYYPSPSDCRTCHTPNAGGVLGVNTRQLNRAYRKLGSSPSENQIRTWNRLGVFEPRLDETHLTNLSKLEDPKDPDAGLEARARSYLDANCAQCHRPGGVVSYFDARYETALKRQNLIDGPVVIDQGIDNARAIAPKDVWRSLIIKRLETLEATKMPPLAHEVLDAEGIKLLRSWVLSLDGPPVLEPPIISPKGAESHKPVVVSVSHSDPEATIRYTLDGSAPGKSSQIYQHPLELREPATLRVRAYKPGYTRSITMQETFVVMSGDSP